MEKIYVIAGATASGKTAAAIELAKRVDGEVISADSMQVYRGMDIGTATPDAVEMAGIPHHLLSIIDPREEFSVAEFQRRATLAIEDISAGGKVPIIAGGTGFYINALLYGADFSADNSEENALREGFAVQASEHGVEFLHARLAQKDPAYAATLHPNNVKRVARALAYCETTGKLFSEYNAAQKAKTPIFDADFFVLSMPRETLYERINARTLLMFQNGLVEEVEKLLAAGYEKTLAAMLGIGYKETVQFLHGEITKAEAIEAIQQATRNYAKRQETWFRNQVRNAKNITTWEEIT